MTNTNINEIYTNAVNQNVNLTAEEKELLLNEKFLDIFVENIKEGLEELPTNDLDELKAAFEEARQEAREISDEEGFEEDSRKGLLEAVGVEYTGDIKKFMFDTLELLIEVTAEVLGLA